MERRLTADEPLLANDGDTSGDASHESPDVSPEGLGGLFIWALTFAAGISGLLFGYEYGITPSDEINATSTYSY